MRVLVAVASRHGSTRDIADAIAVGLGVNGLDAEVRQAREVDDLAGYEAVVLGSSIYMGQWEPDARHFVDRQETQLLKLPVWLFSSGPLAPQEHAPEGGVVKIDEIVRRTNARGQQMFHGKLDRHALSLGERLVVNVVKAPDGDFRDWTAIRTWADEIAAALTVPKIAT